jgi:hypothetical protein
MMAATFAMTASAMVSRQRVLSAAIVRSFAYVALSIVCLVGVEVVERPIAMLRDRSVIPVSGIVAVIDVSVEAVRTMEPGTGADKDPTNEPVGPVVAIRCAIIGRIVEVAVRAYWGNTDIH